MAWIAYSLAFFFVGLSRLIAGGEWADKLDVLDPKTATKSAKGDTLWYDVRKLEVEGKGWADTKEFFHRLPAKAQSVVRKPVWNLSTNTAGMCVRFVTDANRMVARWTLCSKRLAMSHMAATGVSGLDLYVRDKDRWRWLAGGRPENFPTNAGLSVTDIPTGHHEYMLYLPLYNGVESVEIGIPSAARMAKAPPRSSGHIRPICVYGTSITQGGCASRPGMAYTAILGRHLDCPMINLGFSGNGKMDPEIGVLLAELEAAVYVLDTGPNMSPEDIAKRAEPFVAALRKAKPHTPIVLVESIYHQSGTFLPKPRDICLSKNRALRQAYENLVARGVTKLSYVSGERLYGEDGEGTVDGVHATDLGFVRMAEVLEPVLRTILDSQ